MVCSALYGELFTGCSSSPYAKLSHKHSLLPDQFSGSRSLVAGFIGSTIFVVNKYVNKQKPRIYTSSAEQRMTALEQKVGGNADKE